VASGQQRAGFFRGQILKNARFSTFDVPDRIACWRGIFLMLGKLGVEGKDFCQQKSKFPRFFGCSVSDRLLWGILDEVACQDAKAQRFFSSMPIESEWKSLPYALMLCEFAKIISFVVWVRKEDGGKEDEGILFSYSDLHEFGLNTIHMSIIH
jgi:hypothetical protein